MSPSEFWVEELSLTRAYALAMERERDEARAQLASLVESNASLFKETERLKRRELRAYEERDEARAIARRFRKAVDHLTVDPALIAEFDALPWAKDS